MADNKAKKYIALIRIFLCLGVVCLLVGFFIATISTDTVFSGIAIMIAGVFVSAIIALIPAVKLVQFKNAEREDRIKRLEEEMEALKRNNE